MSISHAEQSAIEPGDRLHVRLSSDGSRFELFPKGSHHARYGSWQSSLTDCKRGQRGAHDFLSCPLSEDNALSLSMLWPSNQVDFYEGADTVYTSLLLSADAYARTARIQADFKLDGTLPDVTGIESNADLPLSPHQFVGVAASRLVPGYGLFCEQGTGKTAIAISRVCTDAKIKEGLHASLVVVPKSVRLNWKTEFERFATVPGKVTVLRGGKLERVRMLVEAFSVNPEHQFATVICSYGFFVRSWRGLLDQIMWDLAVLDEAHNICSANTQRARTAFELRDRSLARMPMTGTPIRNSPVDLFSLFEFMQEGSSGFTSFTAFKSAFANGDKRRGQKAPTVDSAPPVLKSKLARCSLIVRKEEVLKDLPEKVYDIVESGMSKKQSEDYTSIADELVLEFERALEDADNAGKEAMVINNALVQMLKLAQITAGFLKINAVIDEFGTEISPARMIRYDDCPKLDDLLEEVKTLEPNEKAIVWACWRESLAMISERFTAAGIDHVVYHGGTSEADREEAIRRFNDDPTCTVWLANQAAGGVGLNLLGYPIGKPELSDTNCTRMIYYSQDWSFVKRDQSEARAHRRGTRVQLRVSDLVVPGTIDEQIRVRVVQKKIQALSLQDLREVLISLREGYENGDD